MRTLAGWYESKSVSVRVWRVWLGSIVYDVPPSPPPPAPLVFTPVGFPFYQYTVDHKRTSGATRENVGTEKGKWCCYYRPHNVNIENTQHPTPDQFTSTNTSFFSLFVFVKSFQIFLTLAKNSSPIQQKQRDALVFLGSSLDWWCIPARTSLEYFQRETSSYPIWDGDSLTCDTALRNQYQSTLWYTSTLTVILVVVVQNKTKT